MGEALKSFFNFTGTSLRFVMWFTTLVVAPATAWFWNLDKDIHFLKSESADHKHEIREIKESFAKDHMERIRENEERTKETKEILRALGRIEGKLGTK